MSEKKLPISYNTPYSTDCRVGMKLAVVQTSPHADAWMATHLGVFMDQELEVRVGSELTEMHMDDFNDYQKQIKMKYVQPPYTGTTLKEKRFMPWQCMKRSFVNVKSLFNYFKINM